MMGSLGKDASPGQGPGLAQGGWARTSGQVIGDDPEVITAAPVMSQTAM